jgi:hypothetical protein
MAHIKEFVQSPRFFIFSDNVSAAKALIGEGSEGVVFVEHDSLLTVKPVDDLYIMTKCRHFIIANSTFSWWAAYLGCGSPKCTVITPKIVLDGLTAWGFAGLIPNNWTVV